VRAALELARAGDDRNWQIAAEFNRSAATTGAARMLAFKTCSLICDATMPERQRDQPFRGFEYQGCAMSGIRRHHQRPPWRCEAIPF
jgi:hypothetical protein